MSIILFFIVLAVLILAHEFGHFITAKRAGIRVDEFGLGFPPRLFKWKRGETTYSINLIPFGGFVKIFGENGQPGERSFADKPRYIQAMVLVAGVVFNLILAWALISAGFMSGFPAHMLAALKGENIQGAKVVILDIQGGSPAEKAGLQVGDLIIVPSSMDEIQALISSHEDDPIEIRYQRGEEIGVVSVVPQDGILKGSPAIGIAMGIDGSVKEEVIKFLPHKAIYEGFKTTIIITYVTTIAISEFLMDVIVGAADFSQIAGPVGIVGMVGDASQSGFIYLLIFTAFLSINLAIINLIPFPALDGGRLLFLVIETIKRSPISVKVTNTLNLVGFFLLMILIIVISYNDILRLF